MWPLGSAISTKGGARSVEAKRERPRAQYWRLRGVSCGGALTRPHFCLSKPTISYADRIYPEGRPKSLGKLSTTKGNPSVGEGNRFFWRKDQVHH